MTIVARNSNKQTQKTLRKPPHFKSKSWTLAERQRSLIARSRKEVPQWEITCCVREWHGTWARRWLFVEPQLVCQLQIGIYQEYCQWLNNKGICHLPLWRLNLMLLYLLTFNNPWGYSGWGTLPQGIWWDRSLDSFVFRNRFYDLNPCISSYLKKH